MITSGEHIRERGNEVCNYINMVEGVIIDTLKLNREQIAHLDIIIGEAIRMIYKVHLSDSKQETIAQLN